MTLNLYTRIVSAVIGVAVAATPSIGDVTIRQQTLSDGLGGLMKSTTMSTTYYAVDKMANDSETKLESKLAKMFGGGKPKRTASMTFLDPGMIRTIQHKDKKYSEMTFEEMRVMMDSLGQMAAEVADPMAGQKPTFDKSQFSMSPPRFSSDRTGKTETIAGFECEQVIITMTTEGTSGESGEKIEIKLIMDQMLAQNVPGSDEIYALSVRLAEAMGFNVDQGTANSFNKMLEMYGIDTERLAEEMGDIGGFAMRTVMSCTMGGDAMADAQSGAQQPPTDEPAQDESTPTDASGLAAKALSGLFGKKDKGGEESEKEAQALPSGVAEGALFWSVTTVQELSTTPVPPLTFEVPNGYKLEKNAFQKQ